MAVSKIKYLGLATINLTPNAIYNVQSELTDSFVIVGDDLITLVSVLKTESIPHWEISALSELVTNSAYTIDSYGTTFRIVSNDSSRLRINSEGEVTSELSQLSFTDEFGGVARVLAVLTSAYRFSISYNQDIAKVFSDLDSFSTYTQSLGWKLCVLADGSIVTTDNSGNNVALNLVGISLTF